MSWFSLILLGLAMSTDAFAASVGKGARMGRPRFSEALRMGIIFGLIEGVTPLIGWFFGRAAARQIEAWDHWIAFSLLLALGLHMIYNGMKEPEKGTEEVERYGLWALIATAVATSIDALAVGVSLGFTDANIVIAALAIGSSTLVMVIVGVMLGRTIGGVLGQRSEVFGGLVLLGIGSGILYSHIT